MFGYSKEELSALKWQQITHPDDLEMTQCEIDDLISGAKLSTRFEKRFIHKNGQIVWADLSSTIQYDNSGNRLYLVSAMNDITDRKKAEDELKRSELRFKTIFNDAPLGVALMDSNTGGFYMSNPKFASITGRPLEELADINWMSITHPDDLDADLNNMKLLLCGEIDGYTMEKRYILPDGSSRWINLTVSHLLKEPGMPLSHLCMIEDISERKQAEQDLIMAKVHAEESDRLKSAFLANMSHEIRTPMNGILGFAELLKEAKLTVEQQHEYLGIIEKSGKRMLNIINDIVDLSKIESGQMKVSVSETNVNEQLEFILALFKPEAEKKGIRLSLSRSTALSEIGIKTDREKVYAILANLVKNAIKYTDRGTIEFGVSPLRKAQSGASSTTGLVNGTGSSERSRNVELQFYVKDTGIGIPKNRQAAIFERFIQANIVDKMARQGAGLGLAISKAYVEMLGGKIWVESELGKGSVFRFTIPYQEANKQNEDNTMEILGTETAIQPKKLKILIVEDDEFSSQLLSIGLQKVAKEIITVQTGTEAVEVCRNRPDIDLVFMDIQLPEMNGYEATRIIRQFNPNLVIIAQTAYALEGDREVSIAAGCTDYISKPIKRDKLSEMVQKYFE